MSLEQLKYDSMLGKLRRYRSKRGISYHNAGEPIAVRDDSARLVFAAWADLQISDLLIGNLPIFDAACADIDANCRGLDAMLIAGDLAENGHPWEYRYIRERLEGLKISNFIFCEGNHDVRLKASYDKTVRTFTDFQNRLNTAVNSRLHTDALNYSYQIKGYSFIVLGTEKTMFEESYLSPERLDRLDSELKLAEQSGLPCFVLCHQPLKMTHGLPDAWVSPGTRGGSVGKQSDELLAIMNRYRNVFYINGHLHSGIGEKTYQKLGSVHSVNLPSLLINDHNRTDHGDGICFIFEVYEDRVLLRARDFPAGRYDPGHDIEIKLG
ncbi:MAG: metallophosphoesterase [Clostridia bacterium]|nr:metallophosphoesterase [Clostridia bacterium]